MKKSSIFFATVLMATSLIACNGSENTSKATETDPSAGEISNNTTNNNNASGGSDTNANLPFAPADSTFAMKAAGGGMFEVEAGRLAQQNAQSERVKGYGAMMVQDHQESNQDLISIAKNSGLVIPTTLPPDKQQMVDQLRNLKGRQFDSRYMGMMVQDHQKTINDFQQQSNSGANGNLKAFAQKTLPVLQKHHDSATAINSSIR